MKHFVILLQWTDDKFINFIDTKTDENYSDSLRKSHGHLYGTLTTSIHNQIKSQYAFTKGYPTLSFSLHLQN